MEKRDARRGESISRQPAISISEIPTRDVNNLPQPIPRREGTFFRFAADLTPLTLLPRFLVQLAGRRWRTVHHR